MMYHHMALPFSELTMFDGPMAHFPQAVVSLRSANCSTILWQLLKLCLWFRFLSFGPTLEHHKSSPIAWNQHELPMKSAWTPWLLKAYPCRGAATAARISPHHHRPFMPSHGETARLASELIQLRDDSHEMPWDAMRTIRHSDKLCLETGESHLNLYISLYAVRVFYWIMLHTSAYIVCMLYAHQNRIVFCDGTVPKKIWLNLQIFDPMDGIGWHWMALVAASVTMG